ncbi:glyoxalase/bleomycin resistance/dioxygenase family protein [Streptomyces vinaceus]|uniref:glyoxalase/bleomycin resistance/dioxygenase family protein n=1 Tax=Streptomyces vinaceus TaxID=1960 RepID=UPI0035DBC7C5
MSAANSIRATLLVVYSYRLEECRRFYEDLGMSFEAEQHGQGPRHFAATLQDGTVFEIYPARPARETGALRMGLTITGTSATPPLVPGRHLLTDPDGRTIDVHAV